MKRVLGIIKNILVAAIFLLAISMMVFTIVAVTTLNKNERDLFGFQAFIVLSDSMSATDFSAGDVILTKQVDPAALQEGDIIAYRSENSDNYGEIVSHKIRSLTWNSQGEPGFITYGTTTGEDDEIVVTYDMVVGKYQMTLPGVGRFFQFLKTPAGYFSCIFLPFFLLIVFQAVNSVRLFSQYKREKQAELQEEYDRQKQELDRQRRELDEKMKQAEQLMARLQSTGQGAEPWPESGQGQQTPMPRRHDDMDVDKNLDELQKNEVGRK